MSNVLAVTADLKRCSIALKFEGQLFGINENVNAPTHLVKLAQDLCVRNKIDLQKIDRIITASGPGSFTGIRTAQSFVKGLSLALNIPAVCASYFQVIKNLFGKTFGQENNLVAVIKSEKNQVYFYDFATGNFGVSPYDSLEKALDSTQNLPLAGDKIDEILQNTEREFFEIKDYKNAKNFLELTEFESKVSPLYINARA
ncbi:MAG: tRNA (adenosine(37)-N6)-threonylcarbamoyltransferase complex dimerization subunit type 1 TsaB [Alphaproteobacteria bacterium]|nr:tRNA (adenosine(37)-N6)-threonylcarbamoyltransferase complex dimerization subunit type 1 TsaB [Alphaproteobacteria bacterium]MBO7642462.1 tRNA (adenosine(37)-N6)-threonylcarbamoyltransferase complex dimerization subunit type 1 TsaB [Alphaproteobacteria bacterium]